MKSVHDLTEQELEELRDRLYHEYLDSGDLDEVFEGKVMWAEDIPIEHVKDHYKEYFFVEEDFWCNTSTDESEHK